MTRTKKRKATAEAGARTSADRTPPAELKDWQCILLLAALVFLFFREILLGNAYLWEDFIYHNYPVRNFAATSMAMGELPLWNPYTFNGMPFLADIQTTVFYLPCTFLALFVRDGTLHSYWLELVVILHYLLAGAGMFYLAKSFSVRQAPNTSGQAAALFAGAAYMLSGFMITHAIHQQIITLVAWYPLILLLFRKAILTPQWKWVFLSGLVLGHSIFAGYPQLSLYFYVFLFAYFLFEVLSTYKGAALASRPVIIVAIKAALIVVISVAVAMVQLLPTIELSDLSQRAQITYEKSTEGSLAWSQLLTFLFPKLFGTAGANGYTYWGPGPYWHFWETCIYLGTLPLLLIVLSAMLFRKNRYVAFFWGVIIFVVPYALGNNSLFHKLFFDFVPGFSTFRNPARMGVILSLAGSLLSAFSIQHLLLGETTDREKRAVKKFLMLALGMGFALWVLVVSGAMNETLSLPKNQQVLSVVGREAHVSLFFLVVSAVAIYMLHKRQSWRRWVVLVLAGVFLVDMLVFGGGQNTAKLNPMDYFKRADQIVHILKQEGESELFRVNTRNSQGMIMDRNQGMISRIQMMEGYTPLALQRVYAPVGSDQKLFDLHNVKYKTMTNEEGRSLKLVPHTGYLPRAFFVYDVRVERDEGELVAFLKSPEFNHRTTAAIEKDPGRTLQPPADNPSWNATVSVYRNNSLQLDVESTDDGFLVLSEIFYPGWKAYIDGRETEIFRTDYNLRGMFVSEGHHHIDVRFEPESFAHGSMITLGTLMVCVFGIVLSMIREKKHMPGVRVEQKVMTEA